jgi:hypothetical protein
MFTISGEIEGRNHRWHDPSEVGFPEVTQNKVGGLIDIGLGYLFSPKNLLYGRATAAYELNPPNSKTHICQNFEINDETTDPATLSCNDYYIKGLNPAWNFKLDIGWRYYISGHVGIAAEAELVIFDGSKEERLMPEFGIQVPMYFRFGSKSLLNFGFRPRLRFVRDKGGDFESDFTLAFFIGGSFRVSPFRVGE